jgi:hypothetical protein
MSRNRRIQSLRWVAFRYGFRTLVGWLLLSAVGATGLSRGLASELDPAGLWILMALMFIGRVGPIILGSAAFADSTEGQSQEELAVE